MTTPEPTTVSIPNDQRLISNQSGQIVFVSSASSGSEDGVSLIDIVRFVHRARWLVAGWVVVCGLLAASTAWFLFPQVYESSATLAVTPPPIISTVGAAPLSVQAYQKLLEGDALIAELRAQLIASGDLKAASRLQVGDQLLTRIFVSKRSEEVSLAPLIEVSALDQDPERAARIANRWTDLFLIQVKKFTTGTTDSSVQLIDQQFQELKVRLATAEGVLAATRNEALKQLNAVQLTGDRTVADAQSLAARNRAAFEDESRRLIEGQVAKLNIKVREELQYSSRKALLDLQSELQGIGARLSARTLELASAKARLPDTPPSLVVRKAISDESAWQAFANGKMTAADRKKLFDQGMVSEQVNPTYTDLTTKIASLEIELAALVPRDQQLRTDIQLKSELLQKDEIALQKDIDICEELKRARAIGLDALIEDGKLAVAVAMRSRDQAIAETQRAGDNRIAAAERDCLQIKEQYSQFAKHQSEAQVAKVQESRADIRLIGSAVPPDRPQRSKRILLLVAGLFAGGIGGLMHAGIRRATAVVR
jgi:capsular polysaccharide biosynthesis protein